MIEVFLKLISKESLNLDKLIRMQGDRCEIYVGEKGNSTILIFIYRTNKAIYFKVMPAVPGKWDCDTPEYYPFGLYGFVKEEKLLIDKIKEKIEVLAKNEII